MSDILGHQGGAVSRRIEVEPFCRHAREAAMVLVLMGAADEVYPSFMVPASAVWSLNGEPQKPAPDPVCPVCRRAHSRPGHLHPSAPPTSSSLRVISGDQG